MKNGIGRGQEFSATEISQVLGRYRRSGLGAVPFAREHGIPPGRLHNWLYQKGRAQPSGPGRARPVRLRRWEDRTVEVRSRAVKSRAVWNRNGVAARRGGEQRNENDPSETLTARKGGRREVDSVGVVGRACWQEAKPVGAGATPLAAGRSPVGGPMVGVGRVVSPPAIIREPRRGSGGGGGERCVWTERRLTRLTSGESADRVWLSLMDKAHWPAHLRRAFDKVWRNGGGAGADGQTVAPFERHAEAKLQRRQEQLREGKYRPQPARRAT